MAIPNFRSIFASFRSEDEERRYMQRAFIKFGGFLAVCAALTIFANTNKQTLKLLATTTAAFTAVTGAGTAAAVASS
ncbi:hypothetical protein GQ42DRAFT_29357 [Ramicandelaber brevisporus]|nr:hypothetical protein GQ42DRAFT_29357 [Ramicandelaber brevisporus]